MKRKVISFILSFIFSTSLALNVKATEASSPTNQNPLTVTNELSEERIQEANKLNINLSDLKDHYNMFIGDDFNQKRLIETLSLDKSLIVTVTSPIPEGVITEDFSGNHEITFYIENSAGNHMEHKASLTISGRPEIKVKNTTINSGEVFTLDKLAPEAYDYEDGDITDRIQVLESDVNLNSEVSFEDKSSFNLVLGVTDNDNNETKLEVTVTVNEPVMTQMAMKLQADNTTKTIAGKNRFLTAIAISKEMFVSSNTAILVASEKFPDALAAGPLATSLNAPILLTGKDTIHEDTKEELKRLKVSKVIIMGGEAAISKNIENELAKIIPGITVTVERIYGKDRCETAIAAAKKLAKPSKIILANGIEFADALSAGSYASANGYPILLTENSKKITSETLEYLVNSDAEIIIVGGTSAVSSDIEAQLKKAGKTVTRVFGSNRYTTALEMTKKFYPTSTMAVVASGENFADALTAVPYASAIGVPILLSKKDSSDEGVTEYLTSSNLANFHFIGGEAAITTNAKSAMMYPSMYDVSYQVADLAGNWSSISKNGQTVGSTSSNGFSQFYIETLGNKDISIRYGAYVTGIGWQNISDSTEVGQKGKTIDSLIMELTGTDANKFDIFYRSYSKNTGWSQWTLGGNPVGSPGGGPILAVESRIIKGNSNKVDKSIFPKTSKKSTYSYAKSSLNLRAKEDSKSEILLVMPSGSNLDVVSVNPTTNWGKINYTARGVVHTGYASMAYINQESLVSNAILTVNGLKNGDSIPTKDIEITGDAAYRKGINTLTYHINGVEVGTADYGYLSSGGIEYGFDTPVKSGYKFTIPAKLWKPSKINSLKVEILGNDGTREFETIYIGGNANEILVTEKYNASFNYFVNRHLSIGYAHINNSVPSFEVLSQYMDPSAWIAHDTYKYMFLDLGYSADYGVTAKQIDDIIKNKGVLHGMGSTFLKAAQDFNINPFYLVAHAILETGHGKSVLANGQQLTHYHEKFGDPDSKLIPISDEWINEKWYNMFGINAYNRDPNLWGAERAYHEGWDTVEKAIYGGAKWIANGYINRMPDPQNTNYKMRYNLKESMSHQYATDIMWAYKQASNIKKQFDAMGVQVPLRFIVPTFDDVRP